MLALCILQILDDVKGQSLFLPLCLKTIVNAQCHSPDGYTAWQTVRALIGWLCEVAQIQSWIFLSPFSTFSNTLSVNFKQAVGSLA